MKLKEIVVHNVGIYLGRHALSLDTTNKGKPIILIGALNGCGKTTILEALKLGLYGKLAKSTRRGSEAYENYLKKLINKGAQPEDGAAIEIAFRETGSAASDDIRVVRSWATNQSGRIAEHVDVYIDGVLSQEMASTWDEEVERFFPQKLCNLFFFDGEEIEALADPARAKEIFNTAINALLGLELVDRANSDLTIIGRKLRQGIVRDDVRNTLESLEATIDDQMQVLRTLAADRARIGHQISEAHERAKRADETFRTAGGDIFAQLRQLEGQLDALRAKRKEIFDNLRELAAGVLPLALVSAHLSKLEQIAKNDAEIQTSRTVLSDLVARDQKLIKWAGGQKWSVTILDELSKYVVEQRRKLDLAAKGEILVDGDDQLLSNIRRLANLEIPLEQRKLAVALNELKRVENEIDRLEHRITKAPSENAVTELALERASTYALLETLQSQLVVTTDRQKAVELEKNVCEAKRDELLRNVELNGLQAELHSRMAGRTDQLIECMRAFKKAVLSKHINRLEEVILDSYRKLLRKEGLVDKIRIDSTNLELSIYDFRGKTIPLERLSAGERQLLATSILWGLARASGRALPIVIDTPLGRLDATHRANLIKHYFPDASHQVILLSTDEEINEKYYSQLKRYISSEYQLVYDESTGGSIIKPGYLFSEAA